MKNGLLIWNVLLTLVVGYLLFMQFGSKKSDSGATKKTATGDSIAVNREFRIAYFEMDSVEANFEMVKDKRAELNKEEGQINAELENMDRTIQQKLNYYRNQMQSGTMTPQQQEAANQDVNQMGERLKNRKQELERRYQDLTLRVNKEMKSAIESFVKEYNTTKGYTYIFANEPGFFYYLDTSYNITDDVVKGLNISYRKKAK